MTKPKILHLIGDQRFGGSNHLVKQLVDSSLQKKFDFVVLKLEEAKLQLKQLRPALIIFHYPCAWKYLLDLVFLKRYSPVFICDHHYCQGFEKYQVPSVFRFHLMLKIAYLIADGVISISVAQHDWMKKHQLVNSTKVRIIQSASKIDALLNIETKPCQSPLKLGAYGRFAHQKGFDVLLNAIALLPPELFQLYLGGYGPQEAQIQAIVAKLPQVKFLGKINDLPAFLSSCDVIVVPSRWEACGLVCLEAKAAGKPVLVSAVDGLCEQVNNCGILVPPDNSQQLAEAIFSLPEQNLALWGKIGRESVRKAWSDFLIQWEQFLQEVITNKSFESQ
ncbi:glycosyltransferase family 4 protein [Gloeothece verrucosa]|uniref:Glycosyl transferase group 1 n=1 Tax=Gloeothece verrucosa (strain PCC 7822) TaxID=497965 RepID=E0UD45_GLOV7|nr:glycosyltransferase [Gloeothece verrucosa]ADN12925.1 glycosyl transferase group 1 [Gloeothece verrucosa PCC 7822]